MPVSPDQLLARLQDLGIAATTHDHAPVFTVAESKALRGSLPGGHCKNLFLKDKGPDGPLWLVVAPADRDIDLKRLRRRLGAKSISFGSPDLLMAHLGVIPGAVTPFAVINDTAGRVRVVLDRALLRHDLLNFHPLTNTRTTAIAPQDLLRFLRACGHEPLILDLEAEAGPPTDKPGSASSGSDSRESDLPAGA